MSSTTTQERLRSRFDARRRPRRGATASRPLAPRGPRTLEDLIAVAVERMERTAPADCPVCGRAELTHAGCTSCGSQLS